MAATNATDARTASPICQYMTSPATTGRRDPRININTSRSHEHRYAPASGDNNKNPQEGNRSSQSESWDQPGPTPRLQGNHHRRVEQPRPAGRAKPDRTASDHEIGPPTRSASETRNRAPIKMNEAATATPIFPFRQPQERESTIRSRARSGPATTPPRHQVPSSPEGEHASDDRHRGRSSRHRPAAASPTDSRRTTSAAPRQATTPRRGTGSRAPRSTPASPPDYPHQGNQAKISRLQNRNGAQPIRSEHPRACGVRRIS